MTLRTDVTNDTESLDTHPALHNETNAKVNELEAEMVLARNYGDDPYVYGLASMDRRHFAVQATALSGYLRLAYIQSPVNITLVKMRAFNQNAGAGITLARYGIYSEAADGAITLLASSANNPALFTVGNGTNEQALTASVDLVKGQRYALALIIVGATMPSMMASQNLTGGSPEGIHAPRAFGGRPGQTDLPASMAGNLIAGSNYTVHMVASP